jgi:hypothetical protein
LLEGATMPVFPPIEFLAGFGGGILKRLTHERVGDG